MVTLQPFPFCGSQVCRPSEKHRVQVALLEALVQRGGACAGQRAEALCLQCSCGIGQAQLHRQVQPETTTQSRLPCIQCVSNYTVMLFFFSIFTF